MQHEFTVCMVVTRNDDAEHFNLALTSLINQTMKPSEIVIVDNGGLTDRHYDIISESGNPHIRLVRIDSLSPVGMARNAALHQAQFPVIAVADPDDINEPSRFMQLIPELNEKVRMVGGWIKEFNETIGDKDIVRKVPCTFDEIVRYARFRSPVNNPTLCYFKEDALAVGGYSTTLRFGEDYDLVMKFIRNKKTIRNIPVIVVNFRKGNTKKLYAKRGGLSLLKQEIKLHRRFLVNKDISWLDFFIIVSVKTVVRLLPCGFFEMFYTKVLRKK